MTNQRMEIWKSDFLKWDLKNSKKAIPKIKKRESPKDQSRVMLVALTNQPILDSYTPGRSLLGFLKSIH